MPKPNIIWIFADQMRGMAMSCAADHHGPDCNVYTPNLDRLASEGTRFTTACSTNPVCVPMRFSLMTGARSISRLIPAIHYRISPAERCIAHEFNDGGWHTAQFGKWHLYSAPMGSLDLGYIPREYRGGFREWHGWESNNNHYNCKIWHDDNREPESRDEHATDVVFDEFDKFLDRRTEPFFATLSIQAPHPQFQVQERYRQAQAPRRLEMHPNVREPGDWPEPDPDHLLGIDVADRLQNLEHETRTYYAMIEHIDDRLGQMISRLKELGIADNTYILFFADHGEMLGSQHRIGKSVPYEESVNIPFIVRGPDIAAGRVHDLPICVEDIFPTTCGLAGIEPQNNLEGLNLSAFLRDPGQKPDRDAVFLEQVEELRQTMKGLPRLPWRAVRTERWMFAALPHKPWLLFDMHNDPYQLNNLVDDPAHNAVREEMIDRLLAHLRRINDQFQFSREGIARHAPDGPNWPIPWMPHS